MKRIGIYAGTFDPVHAGHIAFALQSLQAASLDEIYFLPERRPRNKPGVEHFGHRVAMLKRAAQPHPQFKVLELVDVSLSVERTLPKLEQQFKNAQLVFLFGSDAASDIPDWPNAKRFLLTNELVIGLRAGVDEKALQKEITNWQYQPAAVTMFESFAPHVSSGEVRDGLRQRRPVKGLLHSVARYSDHHWLYVSVG